MTVYSFITFNTTCFGAGNCCHHQVVLQQYKMEVMRYRPLLCITVVCKYVTLALQYDGRNYRPKLAK
jgi:hypothetical protein